MNNNFNIPKEIIFIAQTIENAGFEVFLVGGCVRDLFLNRKPKDWDFTTNALPEDIIKLFPHTFYENDFGTVGVVNDETEEESLKKIEITPYRLEGKYSDNRRPDEVVFAKKLEDDLKRRDFTINSIALNVLSGEVVDPHNGQKDLTEGVIATVGLSSDRFGEDALRILRAVRFHSQLGFILSGEVEKAIVENGHLLLNISKERIRDEFVKIIMSDRPMDGILLLKKLNILQFVVPDLLEADGVEQNKAHSFDVLTHLLKSLQHSADKGYSLEIRLASLFHDISKPETRRWGSEQKQWTFYGHEVLGAKRTKKILQNLKFSSEIVEKVVKLVRWHMFFSDTEQITISAVRRMIANVGKENIWDLMDVRICDRIGTGRPKEDPYRLRKYHSMIEEAMRDPISVSMLKVDGKKIMEILGIPPGPKIGYILNALLGEVLENPKLNDLDYLSDRTVALAKIEENELISLAEKGKTEKDDKNTEEIKDLRKKHRV
jgi:poly(A) polymerase/tRNA nucleotidyltransferase (CCA-adding enzyme)